MIIDELTISLLMLFGVRTIAFLVFLLLFLRHKKIQYFLLLLGWVFYMIAPLPDLISPNPNRGVLHPFNAFSAGYATIFIMLSIASYIRDLKKNVIFFFSGLGFAILCAILILLPEKVGFAVTFIQAGFLGKVLVITIFNRTLIKNNRSSISFFWLCIILVISLIHAFGFMLFLSEVLLALRIVLTAIINLSLLLFFIFLDWEQAQKYYEESIKEKEVLLKEVHHRVKNNLSIITSLLRIQTDTVSNENIEVIKSIENRISTMALVHEQLYRSSNFKDIDIGEYITDLVNSIMLSYGSRGKPVKLLLEIEKLSITVESLTPIGMLINEIVTNSYKHAFKDIDKPEIMIKINSSKEGSLIVLIADNGCGMPLQGEVKNETTGCIIITALNEQLHADCKIFTDNGTKYQIEILDIFNNLSVKRKTYKKSKNKVDFL